MTKYIFAYGSLMNMKYNKELNKNKERKKIPIIIQNLQRHWILCNNNKIYLGIYDKVNFITNGLLIEVTDDEIERLDKRERFYNRKEINKDRINFYYDDILNIDDIIYGYYPNNKTTKTIYDKKNPQCLNYLYICLSGCLKINRKFFIDFLENTKGWIDF